MMLEKCQICREKPPKYVIRFILGYNGLFYELDVCEECRKALDICGMRYMELDKNG